MTKELRLLRNALAKAIEFIDNKRCDHLPPHIVKTINSTVRSTSNELARENIVPKDEVCEQLDISMSQLGNEVRKGHLPQPEPLTEVRVGIRQKHIDYYKNHH